MAILKIAKMGHPVLREPAGTVDDPESPHIHTLIENMLETMVDAGGTGLAAPQVHVPLKVVIFQVSEERNLGKSEAVPLTVLINPVIELLTDKMEVDWEGCLSVPGMIGAVPRHAKISYKGISQEGRTLERFAEGFHARVVQHECDHLHGILYPQRMENLSLLMYSDQLRYHESPDEVVGE